MSLVDTTYTVKLDLVSSMLGSQPTDSIGLAWLRQKQTEALAQELRTQQGMGARDAQVEAEKQIKAKMKALHGDDADAEKEDDADALRITAFHRDERGLYLADYQVKGFIKEAVRQLKIKRPHATAAGKESKADDVVSGLLWVFGADGGPKVYLTRDGNPIPEPDAVAERPLRAMTPRGERTSIAVSEEVLPPCSMTLKISLLRGNPLKRAQIMDILDYGQFQGLGQWRSGGRGRFTYTVLAED